MSTIGPELPPHLASKRKHRAEEEAAETKVASPVLPAVDGSPRTLSPSGGEKRRKVVGPAPPPASLDELPPSPPNPQVREDSSSDDDDFGPAPPPSDAAAASYHAEAMTGEISPPVEKKAERDAWMMVPPLADDLAARMDPSKLRARKFASGKGAKGPNSSATGEISQIWTETPEQKRKRVEDEILGVAAPANSSAQPKKHKGSAVAREEEEKARRIMEHNEKNRGRSLYAEHTKRAKGKEEEDDPSKRAFDREKDMRTGGKIDHKAKKEMISRAADFGSRFSGGGYL